MSINEMDSKIKELRELRCMADELAGEIESITDSIKAHMDAEGVDTISGTDWKVTYKAVTSSRIEKGASRSGAAVHQDHHGPPVLHRMRKAPCPSRPKQEDTEPPTTTGRPVTVLYRPPAEKTRRKYELFI